MGKSLLAFTNPTTVNAGAFFPLGSGSQNNGTTAEGRSQVKFALAGTLSLLGTNCSRNSATGINAKLRKNGADGNQIVNVSADGWSQDILHSDQVAAGDLLDFQFNNSNSTADHWTTRCVFTAAVNHACWYVAWATVAAPGLFGTPAGNGIPGGGSEVDKQLVCRVAGTLQNAQAYFSANTRVAAGTLRSRINGVNGNIAITVPAGATGLFEDAVNSDAIHDGDKLSLGWTHGVGSGSETMEMVGFAIVNTLSAESDLFSYNSPFGVGAGATDFCQITGAPFVQTVESRATLRTGFAGRFRNMRVFVASNGSTAPVTINFRKNGANGNQTITIAAGATGFFEDAVNTDDVVASDDVCLKVSGAVTSGISLDWFGITLRDTTRGTPKFRIIQGMR